MSEHVVKPLSASQRAALRKAPTAYFAALVDNLEELEEHRRLLLEGLCNAFPISALIALQGKELRCSVRNDKFDAYFFV
jgi:hypothetical protein